MAQISAEKGDSRDVLPPLAGLILIGVFFIPGIDSFLGAWFFWVVGLLGVAVVVLIVRAIWRRRPVVAEQPEPLLPIFIHSDEEREQFRAMMGVKEQPPTPIKKVTPHVDDSALTNDPPPER